MRQVMLFFTLMLLITICYAQRLDEEFQRYRDEQEQAFKDFRMEQDSLFIQYKDEIERLWNEFLESTPSDWVSYNRNFTGRSQVDFENGKVDVEAVVEQTEESSEEAAKEIIKEQLQAITQEEDVTNQPILENQIKDPATKAEPLDLEKIDQVADKVLREAQKTEIVGQDGIKRIKYTISFDLVPDHIKIRADKYRPYIEIKCNEFDVEPAVVLAIIHTESYFNPKAYNRHGNAYGMMQIVPKYAGLTMNNVLHHLNAEPLPNDLFDPHKNIEMGVGYIRWLADNKWDKITNHTNQYYCIICSYNGGPGTIYKAMTGKMKNIEQQKWDKMMHDLNTMRDEDLFKHLSKEVPFEETRNYLVKVKERIDQIYSKI